MDIPLGFALIQMSDECRPRTQLRPITINEVERLPDLQLAHDFAMMLCSRTENHPFLARTDDFLRVFLFDVQYYEIV